jgi:hypothetical protein
MVDETLILRKLSELDEYNKQINEYNEPIFKTSPYVQYAFVLENGQSSLADPIYTVLNSNFMQR